MTVMDAIRDVDRLRPNGYQTEDKIRWLERLEKRIWKEILRRYDTEAEEPQTEDYSYPDWTLTAGSPYDEMYIHWLCAQMAFYDQEFEIFNASNELFEAVYGRFRNYYNRTHMPLSARKRYF